MDDLISRSAAKEFLGCDENHKYSSMTMIEVAALLDEVTAIDAEPVRHGRWIVDDLGHTYCSECKTRLPYLHCYTDEPNSDYDEEWDEEIPETRFCPNCGAKMDAKETST